MIKTRLVGLLFHAKKYIVYAILWQWVALLSQVLAVFSIADLLERVIYQSVTAAVVERTIITLILVVVGRLEESIYLSDILYIEAKGKKTLIHMKTGILEASQSLSEMSQLLPAGDFCMPIRWALVSMREITSMPSDKLKLSDQTEIPISRGKREEIKNAFADFRWADMRRRMRGR